jgi:dCMP deaminase
MGVKDLPERYEVRETKYKYCEHAERNAIFMGARRGISCNGGTMYCNSLPCEDCARAIIQCGIKRFIYHKQFVKAWNKCRDITMEILSEARVEILGYDNILSIMARADYKDIYV